MPSVDQARRDLDTASTAVVSAEKDLNTREATAAKVEAELYKLQQQASKASNPSSASSYLRQAQSKTQAITRARQEVTSYRSKLVAKQKTVTQKSTILQKALQDEQRKQEKEREATVKSDKKHRDEQAKHFKAQEASLTRQVAQRRSLTAEVQRSAASFSARVASSDWAARPAVDKSDYQLAELERVSNRIDAVLEQLEKLGLGQSILFDEIEEMKDKSRKLSRKDFKMLLLGKLVAVGTAVPGLEAADIGQIWQDITEMPLPTLG